MLGLASVDDVPALLATAGSNGAQLLDGAGNGRVSCLSVKPIADAVDLSGRGEALCAAPGPTDFDSAACNVHGSCLTG
jgi:hypothetical protein